MKIKQTQIILLVLILIAGCLGSLYWGTLSIGESFKGNTSKYNSFKFKNSCPPGTNKSTSYGLTSEKKGFLVYKNTQNKINENTYDFNGKDKDRHTIISVQGHTIQNYEVV
jgi:hypothetical protein